MRFAISYSFRSTTTNHRTAITTPPATIPKAPIQAPVCAAPPALEVVLAVFPLTVPLPLELVCPPTLVVLTLPVVETVAVAAVALPVIVPGP